MFFDYETYHERIHFVYSAVDTHQIVLTIDLWSEDGSSERNLIVVPAPSAVASTSSIIVPPRTRYKTSSVRSMDRDDRPAPSITGSDGRSLLARARAARGNRSMDICEELEIEEAGALAEEMRSRALG